MLSVSPISEAIRISQLPMHLGLVVAHQAEFGGLKFIAPCVVVEFSKEALKASELQKQRIEAQKVQPVGEVTQYQPFKRT